MAPSPPQKTRGRAWPALALALVLSAGFLYQLLLLGRPLVRDDAALFVYPQHRALAECLKQGHLYLWDHQQWCGLPVLAAGQSGALYPPHLLLFRLLPWQSALHLSYALHLLLAFVAFCWVARNLGLGWRAAAAGAAVYTFSGYQAAHLVHYNFISAAAHLPLLTAVLQTALRRGSLRWWGLLGLEIALAFLCSHPQLFLMLLFVGLVWLLAGQWWRSDGAVLPAAPGEAGQPARLGRRVVSALPGLALALLVALLLCLPQLLPMLELARESRGVYAAETVGATTFASSYAFRTLDLARVLLPDLFGTVDTNVIGGGPAFHETCAFVGAGALLLALPGLVAGFGRRGWWFAVLLLLLGAALVPAGNPVYLLTAKLPLLGSFRAMGRWSLVAICGLSLLVSLGLQALPETSPRRRETALKLTWLAAILLLLGLVAVWVTFGAEGGGLVLPGHPGRAVAVKNTAAAVYNCLVGWEPLLLLLGLGLALAGVQLLSSGRSRGGGGVAADGPDAGWKPATPGRARLAWVLVMVGLVVPLWQFWQTTNRTGPRDYYQAAPATARLAAPATRITTLPPALVTRDDSWRQGAPADLERELLSPAYGTVFGLSYAEGYKQGLVTPATLRLWNDYYRYGVQAFTGETTATVETVERVGTPAERMKRMHRVCAVGAIVTPGAISDRELQPRPGPVKVYAYRDAPAAWLVDEAAVESDPEQQLLRLKERSFDPYRTALVSAAVPGLAAPSRAAGGNPPPPAAPRPAAVSYRGPEAEVQVSGAARPALLVVSQAWYPGWRAYVDGSEVPLLRADYAIKAVPVPAGTHTVQLRFRSRAWQQGLLGALAGVLLAGILCCSRRGGASRGN